LIIIYYRYFRLVDKN